MQCTSMLPSSHLVSVKQLRKCSDILRFVIACCIRTKKRQLLIAIFTLWNTLIIFLHIDIDILDSQSLSLPHGGSKKNVLNLLLLTLWWLVSVVLQYTEPLTLTERVRNNHSSAFKRIRKVCGI